MKVVGSINIFIGILVFIIIWVIVSQVLQMRLLGSIFDKLVSVGVIALIVLFQDEIRHFLLSLGFQTPQQQPVPFPERQQKTDTEKKTSCLSWMACLNMSKGKVGDTDCDRKGFSVGWHCPYRRPDWCQYQPASHWEYLLQEQPIARWSHDYQSQTNKSSRMHSSSFTQPGNP